jgi:3'-5' exoribonuclease
VAVQQEELFNQGKKAFVKDLRPGQILNGCFALTHMALKTYTGGKFLQAKLGDRTGRIAAVMWSGADVVYPGLQIGDIVQVQGMVETYREKPQVTIKRLEKVEDVSDLDPNDFLPAQEIDVSATWEELQGIAGSVQNPWLLELLAQFFQDEGFVEGFLRAPGGKQWHHGYLGGLVEHTLGVLKNSVALAGRYPFVNRDALITGAIFHDLGKVLEFVYSTVIDYSDAGRLVGHQIMGDQKMCEYASRIENFPQELLLEIRHLILSHHGDSPDAARPPLTREALILSRADDLDAQMNAYTREILKARVAGRKWSDYVNLIGRYLYDTGGNDDTSRLVIDD